MIAFRPFTVVEIVSFNGDSKENLLRLAACMEEHFPHSMAKAVMDAAKERGLTHEEMHSKVEYIVAHGISTTVNGRKAIIGSHHFVTIFSNLVDPDVSFTRMVSSPSSRTVPS